MAKGNFLTGGIFVDGETPVLKSDVVMPANQALQQKIENPTLESILRQANKSEPPVSNKAPLYTPSERTTSENFSGEDLKQFKNLATPEEQLQFAKDKFRAYGQTVKSVSEGGQVKMDDYFKAYPTQENFNQDMAKLLATHEIGSKPISDEDYGKNLQKWYATYTRKKKINGKEVTEKAYAEDLMGTKRRANDVRVVVTDPSFNDLSPEQQAQFLSRDYLLHDSFKSKDLVQAEKQLKTAQQLKAKKAIRIAQDRIDSLKNSGQAVDAEKMLMMKENMQRGWESAKNISEKLNNNVSPEILFTQMAMESKYFTKPIAQNNLTSIKITSQDRGQMHLKEILKDWKLIK